MSKKNEKTAGEHKGNAPAAEAQPGGAQPAAAAAEPEEKPQAAADPAPAVPAADAAAAGGDDGKVPPGPIACPTRGCTLTAQHEGDCKVVESEPAEGEPLTLEQRERLRIAPVATIRRALQEPDLPKIWRVELEAELRRREAIEKAAALKGDQAKQYVVLRDSRYVVGGAVHTLHAGGLMTEHTHNLVDVAQQGVPFRQLGDDERVVLETDQLGRKLVRVVKG